MDDWQITASDLSVLLAPLPIICDKWHRVYISANGQRSRLTTKTFIETSALSAGMQLRPYLCDGSRAKRMPRVIGVCLVALDGDSIGAATEVGDRVVQCRGNGEIVREVAKCVG